MVVLILISAACALYLIWFYAIANKTEKAYDSAKVIAEKEFDIELDTNLRVPINFKELQEVNPDVYAWIRIDDTMIDYPVVCSMTDNEFYLDHTWEGKYAPEGAIFSESYNSQDFSDYNTILYGHRMGNGVETMFYQLRNYLDAEFMEEHKEIVVYTPKQVLTYEVFAAVIYDDRHLLHYYDYDDEEQRQAFLDSIWNSRDMRNQFRKDVEVTTDDRILSLSTCIRGEKTNRLIVGAVLISEE